MTEDKRPFHGEDEGSPIERVGWRILQAIHTNVPEEKRPMSWSDCSAEQQTRIRQAAEDAIEETVLLYDRLRPPLRRSVTQRVWIEAALAGVLQISGYRRSDKEYFFFQDDIWRIRKAMQKAVEGSRPEPERVENLIDALETVLTSGLNIDTRKKAKLALAVFRANTDRMEELNETSPN